MIRQKILNFSEVKKLAFNLKSKNKRIVFTNGCFDLIHAGHIEYLQKAKKLGDALIVGINSDFSVRKIKGDKRPITGQNDRAAIIAALEAVDYVLIFNEATPLKLIKALRPDVLVKGADWDLKNIVGGDFIKSYGGKVRAVSLVKGRSTSNIIRKIVKRFK